MIKFYIQITLRTPTAKIHFQKNNKHNKHVKVSTLPIQKTSGLRIRKTIPFTIV